MAVERQAESETGRGGGGTDAGEQGERRRRQGEEREEERGGMGARRVWIGEGGCQKNIVRTVFL